jgi:hypothetical protein
MIEVVVNLTMATMCFLGQCHPVLVGSETPTGVFSFQHARIRAPGYGGDVLVYDIHKDGVPLSVHRVYLGNPRERRAERLRHPNPAARIAVTNGCINVAPEVYDALVDCCRTGTLRITK